MKTDPVTAYVDQFAAQRAALPGNGIAWLDDAREAAIARFAEVGFPTNRDERWKFTDLRRFARTSYAPAPRRANGVAAGDIAAFLPDGLDCHLMVFVDGHARPDLSDIGALPEGARLISLAEVIADDAELVEPMLADAGVTDAFGPAALNAALMADGAVLTLAPGVMLEKPVHLLYLGAGGAAPAAAHLRNLVVAGAGSAATLIESYAPAGGGAFWTNAVTDIAVDRDAAIRHVKVQAEGAETIHIAATRVRLGGGARYDSFAASVGGRLSRNEISAVFDGEHGECRLGGAYLPRGRQHMDTTTLIDHAKPECTSHEHYRGVIDDQARGVFQGKIVVRAGAQKTDAHQLNKNLLLSETARVDTKPELEILADDVKCSHGATAGELDADALFYLRSRGIDAESAQNLLVEAFVGEIIETVEDDAIKAHLWRVVTGWLPQVNHSE